MESLPAIAQIRDPEVRRFLEERWELIEELYAPVHLILFGSRINGTPNEWSDIDLIIVSDRFEGMKFLERSHLFCKQVPFRPRVDAFCYAPDEFERIRRQIGVIADACREGLWVVQGELKPDWEVSGVMTPEEQAQSWIGQGDHDLNMARVSFDNESYEWAAALAQQAAEKFLKALHIFTFHATPPRTHNIESLAKDLRAPSDIVALGKPLTEDYLRARYPDLAGGVPHDLFDAATAQERIAAAEKIREWVVQQLGQGGAP